MAPSVSIIIPAHNEEKYLSKTLHSIQQQTNKDYEVLVVVNGCTDTTEEILKNINDDAIRVLSLAKPNVSRARNYGAGKAKGEILVFVDADTVVQPDLVEKISTNFTTEYAIASTKVMPDSEEVKYKLAMSFKNLYMAKGVYKGCSGVLICRRDHFDQVAGYDPKIIAGEHRKLISKLQTFGKYRCLDTTATTSMRRFQQWGLSKSVLFWTKQWLWDNFGDPQKIKYDKIR
ncbi:MAG: glycosyltransferase [Nanoarchaeota archaeon]|nr:glycosyltransferase [Nanoarchaeota archaeon]